MKLDELNFQIIKQLRDGRKLFRIIAEELSVARNTVRTRVQKMINDGVLKITGLVNPDKLPNHQVVILGVKVDYIKVSEKAREFSKIKGVVSVVVVTGRYDIILTVLLNENFNLLDFFNNEMSKIDGVRDCETFTVLGNVGFKVPYVL